MEKKKSVKNFTSGIINLDYTVVNDAEICKDFETPDTNSDTLLTKRAAATRSASLQRGTAFCTLST